MGGEPVSADNLEDEPKSHSSERKTDEDAHKKARFAKRASRAGGGASLLVRLLFLLLSRLEPFEEFFRRLADFLAGGQVDVLLAGLVPGLEDVVGDEILLVIGGEDLVDFGDELGALLADEVFGAAQESFLVAF